MPRRMVPLLFVLIAIAGCSIPSLSPAPKPTREEMRSALEGKTTVDVLAMMGKPDDTSEFRDGRPSTWSWRAKTRNAVNGKTDAWLFVGFTEGGKVWRVDFD